MFGTRAQRNLSNNYARLLTLAPPALSTALFYAIQVLNANEHARACHPSCLLRFSFPEAPRTHVSLSSPLPPFRSDLISTRLCVLHQCECVWLLLKLVRIVLWFGVGKVKQLQYVPSTLSDTLTRHSRWRSDTSHLKRLLTPAAVTVTVTVAMVALQCTLHSHYNLVTIPR